MTVGKPNLISKLAGIYRYLCEFELLTIESNEYEMRLDQTGCTLKKLKTALVRSIIMLAVFLSGVMGILFWTGSIQNIVQGVKTSFSGYLDTLLLLAISVLLVLSVIFLIRIPVNLKRILKSKNTIAENQKMLGGVIEKFKDLFISMADEKADTEEMFPDNNFEYPFSRYVKYAIDVLNSGRADDFKEIMSLIDELAHREKLLAEVEKRSRSVKQAALSGGKAFRTARNAERAVKRSAGNAS